MTSRDLTMLRFDIPPGGANAYRLQAVLTFVISAACLGGWWIGQIPALALLVFSFIDLTTGFCAACWGYGLWFPMRSACAV